MCVCVRKRKRRGLKQVALTITISSHVLPFSTRSSMLRRKMMMKSLPAIKSNQRPERHRRQCCWISNHTPPNTHTHTRPHTELLAHAANNLKGKLDPVFVGAAPAIFALVRALHNKLVDQVACNVSQHGVLSGEKKGVGRGEVRLLTSIRKQGKWVGGGGVWHANTRGCKCIAASIKHCSSVHMCVCVLYGSVI